MLGSIRSIGFVALLLIVTSCSSFIVEGDGKKTAQSKTKTETFHSSFYGFDWSEWNENKCDNSDSLYRVRTHTNLAYAIAAVASLGLYVPTTVEWWCSSNKKDDPEDVYVPSDKEEY